MEMTHFVIVNEGTQSERTEVVKPLKEYNGRTLVAFVKGGRILTRWVKTERVQSRERG